jgi:pyruvate kinase
MIERKLGMRRARNAKIVATLGPASNTPDIIRGLFHAGADVFRLNFSHATHEDHKKNIEIIRQVEIEFNRPIPILIDLQGPKLRVGKFHNDIVALQTGQKFRLDLNPELGDTSRVQMPHPEIFSVLKPGIELLLDDGKLRLKVERSDPSFAETTVLIGGNLSNKKGVNVPGVMLPISAMTEKDKQDLEFGLNLGADWVALSFVQRPQDILDARQLVYGRAKIAAKIEKPMAIENLDEIISVSDAIMVARGDLGVEMNPEDVPILQKQMIKACRIQGKPVIVATQMLDSMVNSPSPTRAEASDVANAIYEGADAVMLSAESASGKYPIESVTMMNRIIERVEKDPIYRQIQDMNCPETGPSVSEAIPAAARQVAHILPIRVIATFTETGATTLRAARERPSSPIIALTPDLRTARHLTLVWGVHALKTDPVRTFQETVQTACSIVKTEKFGELGDQIIVIAGVPFGQSGGTNILRVAKITDSEEIS